MTDADELRIGIEYLKGIIAYLQCPPPDPRRQLWYKIEQKLKIADRNPVFIKALHVSRLGQETGLLIS